MARSKYAPDIPSEHEPWRKDASCLGSDPDLFFPLGWTKRYEEQILKAKAVCAGCKVIDICLEYSLKHGEEGIWGGTTKPERSKIIRLRNDLSA